MYNINIDMIEDGTGDKYQIINEVQNDQELKEYMVKFLFSCIWLNNTEFNLTIKKEEEK